MPMKVKQQVIMMATNFENANFEVNFYKVDGRELIKKEWGKIVLKIDFWASMPAAMQPEDDGVEHGE